MFGSKRNNAHIGFHWTQTLLYIYNDKLSQMRARDGRV